LVFLVVSYLLPLPSISSMHFSYLIRAICSTTRIHLDVITLIILPEEWKSGKSLLCSYIQPPITPLSSVQIFPLSTLFSITLSLWSSVNVGDKISHPCRTTDKIIVLYIVISTFLDSGWEDKKLWTEW
jgi:hypothetical protein